MGERWWHYTKGRALLGILAEGQIKRASTGVMGSERRAVWFSSRLAWEPTATIGAIEHGINRYATIDEMVKVTGPLVRLEVPAAVARHTWTTHRRIGQIDPRTAERLEAVARERGANPDEWRVTYHDVPLTDILSIEASDDGLAWSYVGGPDTEGFLLDHFIDSVLSGNSTEPSGGSIVVPKQATEPRATADWAA